MRKVGRGSMGMSLKHKCFYQAKLREVLLQDSWSFLPWREAALCSKKEPQLCLPRHYLLIVIFVCVTDRGTEWKETAEQPQAVQPGRMKRSVGLNVSELGLQRHMAAWPALTLIIALGWKLPAALLQPPGWTPRARPAGSTTCSITPLDTVQSFRPWTI